MPEFIRFLTQLRQDMSAELTRSDVLRALIWPSAGLLLALIAGATADVENWILMTLLIILCLFMALYGASYVYFAIRDPDALRSEKYKLQKMAIESGLYGDNEIGLIEQKPTLASPPEKAELPKPSEEA